MYWELLENKKPRFKNRGLSCGPIRANGSNQVDLSLITEKSITCFHFNRIRKILGATKLQKPFTIR